MISQFGTATISLSDLVKDFNIEQGNVTQNHYIKNLVHAKWAWKNLLLSTLWSMRQKIVAVNPDKTVTLPKDVVVLLTIAVQDECGIIQTFDQNPRLNTVEDICDVPCSCSCKGEGTLCGVLDTIQVRTETVVLKGLEYTKKIYTRKDTFGNIMEWIETPIWDDVEEEVVTDTTSRVICVMDTTETGCIKKTKANEQLLKEHCGCYIPVLCCRNDDSIYPRGKFGDWNWDADNRQTIHLFNTDAKHVIIGYKGNSNCSGEEILLPEYAEFLVKAGIMYRQKLFSPILSLSEKREAERVYKSAKTELRQTLNPINMKIFSSLHDHVPKW